MVRFGYLKTVPDPKITIDHRPIQFKRNKPNYEVLKSDFLQDYPDAKEKIDRSVSNVESSIWI